MFESGVHKIPGSRITVFRIDIGAEGVLGKVPETRQY